MVSRAEITKVAGAAGPDVVLRAARPEDCRRIAQLFRISSDSIADYIWSTLQADYRGASLIEIGARRYARESTAFSYQNCLVAEQDGAVIAMPHAFVIATGEQAPAHADIDPVLRPYAELEAPGSLYVGHRRGAGVARPGPRDPPPGGGARAGAPARLPGAEPDLLRPECAFTGVRGSRWSIAAISYPTP